MTSRAAASVAGIIDRIEGRPYRTGRPPVPTAQVVEASRYFAREGVQWRELRAAAGRACGSTPRRRLDEWGGTALLRQAHAALIRMVRAGPGAAARDVVVDSCSARAKRGGELTGPNPTDRGKRGTEYHVVVAGGGAPPGGGAGGGHVVVAADGTPPGVVPSAANVHDTRLFPHLPHLASAVRAAVGRLHADAAYHSAENRGLCAREGIRPCIREVGAPHGPGPGAVRCVVEHDCAWLLADRRLDRRQDRLGRVILALLTAACIFLIANRLSPFWKRCLNADLFRLLAAGGRGDALERGHRRAPSLAAGGHDGVMIGPHGQSPFDPSLPTSQGCSVL
jgi:transposase